MFEAKHKHSALYKIHYTIYLCLFCNNFIRSCHMDFPSPNRKGLSSFLKHPHRLWGSLVFHVMGKWGIFSWGIKQLQRVAAAAAAVR
jgi:hypothetical protein